ncbi:MAG: tetratricopeptide repeat protein [Oscillospiraceae bacterium]|nr:tetratricopeptide repeat protein [Oscillospiraceae bacterium]
MSGYLETYFKALSIFEKTLEKDHPNTTRVYNNIGVTYLSIGDYDKSLEYTLKAYLIMLKYGANHPNTQDWLHNLKLAYQATNNPTPFKEWLAQKLIET